MPKHALKLNFFLFLFLISKEVALLQKEYLLYFFQVLLKISVKKYSKNRTEIEKNESTSFKTVLSHGLRPTLCAVPFCVFSLGRPGPARPVGGTTRPRRASRTSALASGWAPPFAASIVAGAARSQAGRGGRPTTTRLCPC